MFIFENICNTSHVSHKNIISTTFLHRNYFTEIHPSIHQIFPFIKFFSTNKRTKERNVKFTNQLPTTNIMQTVYKTLVALTLAEQVGSAAAASRGPAKQPAAEAVATDEKPDGTKRKDDAVPTCAASQRSKLVLRDLFGMKKSREANKLKIKGTCTHIVI